METWRRLPVPGVEEEEPVGRGRSAWKARTRWKSRSIRVTVSVRGSDMNAGEGWLMRRVVESDRRMSADCRTRR